MITTRTASPTGALRQIELTEWQGRDVALSPSEAADLCGGPSNVLQIQRLHGGMYRLQPRAVVGRLRLGRMDVLIRPKCPMPSLLAMLVEAHELAGLTPQFAGFDRNAEVVDLLVQIFLKQVDHIVRQGLKRTYIAEEEELVAVRGRIDLRKTLGLHAAGKATVHCGHEEYTLDGPENGTLLAALIAIANSDALPIVRRNLAYRLSTEFPGVRAVDATQQQLQILWKNRLTLHYFPALPLAHLILDRLGIQHDFGGTEANGFLLDMNRLFEVFVCRKLQKALAPARIHVDAQATFPFDVAGQAVIKPDLMIRGPNGRQIVADTKYKIGTRPEPSDLYQMLTYCCVRRISHGILITAGTGTPQQYQVHDGKTVINVIPVDLRGSVAGIDASVDELAAMISRLLDVSV